MLVYRVWGFRVSQNWGYLFKGGHRGYVGVCNYMELNLSCYIGETPFFTIYTNSGN